MSVQMAASRVRWTSHQGIAGLVAAPRLATHIHIGESARPAAWPGRAKGAFTGAPRGASPRRPGARLTLIGHSERRHVFGETDEQTGKKLAAALAADLQPVLVRRRDTPAA